MIQELQSAIVSRATSAGAFNTAIGGKFYFFQAPGGTTGKYAVLSDVANPVSRDSGDLYEECFFQIALYETANNAEDLGSSAGVHDLFQKCVALFDDCESALTVTNYDVVQFTRLNIIGPRKVEGGWVIIINYLAVLQKDR
jgi:hypothetical protein